MKVDNYLDDLQEGVLGTAASYWGKKAKKAAHDYGPAAIYAGGKTAQKIGSTAAKPVKWTGKKIASGVVKGLKSTGAAVAKGLKDSYKSYLKRRQTSKNIKNLKKNIARNRRLAAEKKAKENKRT